MPKAEAAPADAPDIARYRVLLQEKRGGSHAYVALLGLRSFDALSLHRRAQSGLDFSAFERFQRNVLLTTDDLAAFVQISPRTLVRRREEGRLNPAESDRLIRASRVFGKALELFEGDVDATRRWFSTKVPALDGRTPLEVASSEIGAREVEDLVGRLEHGVFS
jgi:putative toxin-antitoxin system antitoxin component (TIGR02293 family)